jgi:hypothetical protein
MPAPIWKDRNAIYKLYAVIRWDIANSHCIAVINVQMTGKWMIFDDETVREPVDIDELKIILGAPYCHIRNEWTGDLFVASGVYRPIGPDDQTIT